MKKITDDRDPSKEAFEDDTISFENILKLPEIKKMRRISGGATYTLIFLKILLFARDTNIDLPFNGIESNLSEELALKLDEEIENIEATLILMEQWDKEYIK